MGGLPDVLGLLGVLSRRNDLGHRVRYAEFLHVASEVQFFAAGKDTHWNLEHARGLLDVETDEIAFRLPVVRPDVIVPVIEVFLEEE